MAHKIDIKYRNRIIINKNGQRLKGIQGQVDTTHQVATLNVGVAPTSNRSEEGTGEPKEEEVSKDLSLEKLSPEEQATLKSLMAKLNG